VGKVGSESKIRNILLSSIGVVALVAVIFVGGALSNSKKDATPTQPAPATNLAPSVQSAKFANEAQVALSQGETQTALSLAEQSLKLDATNEAAAAVINTVRTANKKPSTSTSGDSGSSGSTPSSSADKYDKQVKDISTLLPVSIDGWIPGPATAVEVDALVTFEPQKGTAPYNKVVRAVLAAHDRKTPAKAKEFIEKVDKRGYARNAGSVKVNNVTAYFGTDDTGVAIIAFARGRYAFEVSLNVPQGGNPAAIKDIAVAVAKTLPASK